MSRPYRIRGQLRQVRLGGAGSGGGSGVEDTGGVGVGNAGADGGEESIIAFIVRKKLRTLRVA